MPNQPTLTFGFESEFQRNAQPLAGELHRRGLWADTTIHGWHCECPACSLGEYPFKVQRDSTVDGEVISRVFTVSELDTEAADAMRQLQEAAIEVDAEPGYDAGLHVHVKRPRGDDLRAKGTVAYLLWESALISLAAGRFHEVRAMNRPLMNDFVGLACRHNGGFGSARDNREGARRWLKDVRSDVLDNLLDDAVDIHDELYGNDRHAHLCLNTRFNTWEFRIWNSTRSAWRMEMAVRTSLAFVNPTVIGALLEYDGIRSSAELRHILQHIDHDPRLVELIDRQIAYNNRAELPPTSFLVA